LNIEKRLMGATRLHDGKGVSAEGPKHPDETKIGRLKKEGRTILKGGISGFPARYGRRAL